MHIPRAQRYFRAGREEDAIVVVAVLADYAREQAGSGGIVTQGLFDACHEVGEFEGFIVADNPGEGNAGRGHFGGDFAVGAWVGEDLEEAGADYCCCCVGAGEAGYDG